MSHPRKLSDWLEGFVEYAKETEAPTRFWTWSGLFILGSAMQRKVWIDYGVQKIYPNLFVVLVAPPGRCRKAAPIKEAKRLLGDIGVSLGVESTTKRALTQDLAAANRTEVPSKAFKFPIVHSSLSIVSEELSSLLHQDVRTIIEALTDLYDCGPSWKYKTATQGEDKIIAPFVSLLAATTPAWLSSNLPLEAIGGGFTSRIVFAPAVERVSRLAWPKLGDYEPLLADLKKIHELKGEASFSPEAKGFYQEWYEGKIDKQYYKEVQDERFHPFLERVHAHVLKASLGFMASEGPELIIQKSHIEKAIKAIEELLPDLPQVLAGRGKNRLGGETFKIMAFLQKRQTALLKEINENFWTEVSEWDLRQILRQLKDMGKVEVEWVDGPKGLVERIKWTGGAREKSLVP